MLDSFRKRARSVAVPAVAAALTVGGVALAQGSNEGGSGESSGTPSGKRMPAPPMMVGAPGGKDLTYAQLHVQHEGKAEVIRMDQGEITAVDDSTKVLAGSFNEMSEQLGLARDAERAVLLSVSHDLRTPLTSIRGYAEGIEDGTVEPRQAAAVVGREAERLGRLVGDLLALARLRQGVMEVRREPVDLATVAREAEERLRPRAVGAGVTVRVEGGPAPATADHGRVLQVVTNLLDKAIRVSPEGKTVTIRTSPGAIEVSDEGPGIAVGEIPQAFERFHLRARAEHGAPDGAGLGLAIVRELSEAMGGSASVENLPAQGARFTIRLPT
jgi:two-component system sensor histidine kinase BaeS